MNKIFILLFLIITTVISFIVFIIPDFNEFRKIKAETVELERNIEIIKNLEISREVLEREKLSISNRDIERLNKLIPSSAENIKLIIEIDEIAKRNGLTSVRDVAYDTTNDAIIPGQEVEQSPYKSFEVKFSTSGQYNQFVLFLEELEKNLRLVDITSIDLKNNETTSARTVQTQDFEVTLKAYWLNEVYE